MNRKFITCAVVAMLMSTAFVACGDDEPATPDDPIVTPDPEPDPNPGTTTKPKPDPTPVYTDEDWKYPVDIVDVTTGDITTGDDVDWPIVNHRPYETGTFRAAIDYTKHPHFRLACGISAYELTNKNNAASKVVMKHFDEVTMGNEQKYSSIVRGDGSMDFGTVKNVVNFCKQNNIGLFGHTLAWHSQQQVKYLQGLVKNCSTDEERKQALIDELERWIGGCMEATEGYVSCWDAVNEAIAGDGNYQGKGIYVLQGHGNTDVNNLNKETDNFYWQDFLGAEDYIPIVFNIAREKYEEYGGNPKHLKLFINDYNLESDWDGNKKLKSLIEWINIWEAKGCYVDGIGTQMHISCYADKGTNDSKKRGIENMFRLMAATGKLCKITELDMGFKRKGNEQWYSPAVEYDKLTPDEAKAMADLYQFVVTKYFEIIPPEQQFGITQWCLADSPKQPSYVWRKGEPAGFWHLNFRGEWPMYYGFLQGLLNSHKIDNGETVQL